MTTVPGVKRSEDPWEDPVKDPFEGPLRDPFEGPSQQVFFTVEREENFCSKVTMPYCRLGYTMDVKKNDADFATGHENFRPWCLFFFKCDTRENAEIIWTLQKHYYEPSERYKSISFFNTFFPPAPGPQPYSTFPNHYWNAILWNAFCG